MIIRCLLLVAGSINAFAFVQQCPNLRFDRISRAHLHTHAADARTRSTTATATATARTYHSRYTYTHPRRFPRTATRTVTALRQSQGQGQEGSDPTQDNISADENFLLLDSPLSQLSSEQGLGGDDGASPPPLPFARNDNWLEDATDDILDEEIYPDGSLAEGDLETINALMVAWVRRRSTEAALTVERLLKRVVDDMHAGNDRVHVNTRMYTYVSVLRVTSNKVRLSSPT
jgi:hypothetical protein